MKKLFLGLIFCLLAFPAWAACSGSGTLITCTASSNVAQINQAIQDVDLEGTVAVASGSGTWSGTVSIDRNVVLQGAGKTLTIITGGTISAVNTNFELSDFKFINLTMNISESVASTVTAFKVHNNHWANTSLYAISIKGSTSTPTGTHPAGVFYSNIFRAVRFYVFGDMNTGASNADKLWNLSDTAGSPTNVVYVEDNEWANTGLSINIAFDVIDSNYGGRYVFRYNTIDHGSTEHHGIQGAENRGVSFWENYRNDYEVESPWYSGTLIRSGGRGSVIFGNTYGTNYTNPVKIENQTSYRYDEYSCNNWGCDGNNPRDANRGGESGYPCRDQIGRGRDTTLGHTGDNQEADPVYIWSSTVSGSLITPVFNVDGCVCGDCNPNRQSIHIVNNRDYYYQNVAEQTSKGDPFTGASGIGVGTLAQRPDNCTTGVESGQGVGYWATDQGSWNISGDERGSGVLYQCTSTNNWEVYYTPYTYPHPLRGEASIAGITGGSTLSGGTIQ